MIGLSRMRLFEQGIRVPRIEKVDFDKKVITMEYLVEFQSLKNLIRDSQIDLNGIGYKIGVQIGKIHENGVIHGDLTSSNIMIRYQIDSEVAIIDFGLSQVSKSQEHRAVDLLVFEKSLLCEESSLNQMKELLKGFFKGYIEQCLDYKNVMKRLEEVKRRGRKKSMIGQIYNDFKLMLVDILYIISPNYVQKQKISMKEFITISQLGRIILGSNGIVTKDSIKTRLKQKWILIN